MQCKHDSPLYTLRMHFEWVNKQNIIAFRMNEARNVCNVAKQSIRIIIFIFSEYRDEWLKKGAYVV